MESSIPTPVDTPQIEDQSFKIVQLTADTAEEDEALLAYHHQLTTLLQDVVNPGSSIGFLAPLSYKEAGEVWFQVFQSIAYGTVFLYILTSQSNPATILGTIQLATIPKPTHTHRADIIKLLVSPSARRRGIGTKLMEHVESVAKKLRKEVLTLDTATNNVASMTMYRKLQWEEWGTCRGFASDSDGKRIDITFFRKDLEVQK